MSDAITKPKYPTIIEETPPSIWEYKGGRMSYLLAWNTYYKDMIAWLTHLITPLMRIKFQTHVLMLGPKERNYSYAIDNANQDLLFEALWTLQKETACMKEEPVDDALDAKRYRWLRDAGFVAKDFRLSSFGNFIVGEWSKEGVDTICDRELARKESK